MRFLRGASALVILLTLASAPASAQNQQKPLEDKDNPLLIGKRDINNNQIITFLATLTPGSIVVAQSQSQDDGVVVVEGAQARLSLQTQLSSKLSEVGDEVRATLYEPVRDADGRVAIPRGTEFVGRVTQVQPARRPQKQATLTVVFDTMRLSHGAEKVSVVVTAIDDFANDEKLKSKDGEGKVGGGHSGGRTARNAGTGATLGGVGGLIIGAAGGGLGGVAAGAGAGVVGGVLMTKGNDIKLQPGAILRIRFERPVNLPALESERLAPQRNWYEPNY